jgi:hypothetical protein
MNEIELLEADRRQIAALGMDEEHLHAQLETFRASDSFVALNRPCTLEDGVFRITSVETTRYIELQEEAALKGRFAGFVPASGAASRMFQTLTRAYHDLRGGGRIDRRITADNSAFRDLFRFADAIEELAFFEDLQDALSRDGLSLESLIAQQHFLPVLEYLLTPRGLNYDALPKGLLRFHRYPDERRTAFQEHLVDAAFYTVDERRRCKIHFTVSPEHEDAFRKHLESVRHKYESRYGVTYEVGFSLQRPSTNTVAVDLENRPFRDMDGKLVFRPGGHGALLGNLNDLGGDLVYIKNIDNVVPDRLKETAVVWKKVLGGFLVDVQDRVRSLLKGMERGLSQGDIESAGRFAKEKLLIHLPESFEGWTNEQKSRFLLEKLNRPIRVCGVVPNAGEPGGAPFWVQNRKGGLSVQIVEKAQVDFASPEQNSVWMSSTHFNPVDIVCAVRDTFGKPFDLTRYVDPAAVFISRKSKDGRELKALELPGLWNGAMADWITLIVEVPSITFNPVKTVFDLLRPEHQNP